MKRVILFSTFLAGEHTKKLLKLIFPSELKNRVVAYMPSDGAVIKKKYLTQWKQFAIDHDAKFNLINNSKTKATDEKRKLLSSNILVITGGNTFTLLRNLRRSGLDKAIKEFSKKDNFVLAGFSAGAIVLTPTINVCNLPNYDKNEVGTKDLTGLNIVDFEVFPHYSKKYKKALDRYKATTTNKVIAIADDNVLTINL